MSEKGDQKEDGDANAVACSLARSLACLRVSVSCRPWPLVGSLARSTAAGPANSTTPAAAAAAATMLLYFRRRAGGSRGFRGFADSIIGPNIADCYLIHSSVFLFAWTRFE